MCPRVMSKISSIGGAIFSPFYAKSCEKEEKGIMVNVIVVINLFTEKVMLC